ncbi:MAG TPA: response regulator [Bryobacteraceae bacterium]|nr:response regulator [Bryobacteraceae bacterium]
MGPQVELHFAVRDTGIGIPGEKLQTIFQAFTQADSSTTRRYGGTGLGLTISKRLVEMMGGRLSVESEVQQGSIFRFTVPVRRCPNSAVTQPLGLESLQGVPVLIVDDNPTNRRMLAEWASNWGMRPLIADSGASALQALAAYSGPLPLVLSDVHMPEMDGFELVTRIKSTRQAATVIMLTSGSYAGDVARCRELGVEAYLMKPVRQGELLATVQHILATNPYKHSAAAAPREAASSAVNSNRVDRGDALRALVVEDNVVNQRVALNILEKASYSVVVVGNGREALAALDRELFDLILMDIQMPEMDGLDEPEESARGRSSPVEEFPSSR